MPTRVAKPAIDPMAITWYMPSEMPTLSVHDFGTPGPMTWPIRTNRMPKWNSGLPMRSSRDSYSCDDRVGQPNLSYLYRQKCPTMNTARQL